MEALEGNMEDEEHVPDLSPINRPGDIPRVGMSSIERRNTAGLVLFAMFQGLIIIPNLPFMTYLYDDLGLTPGQLSIFNGFINYVWAFKVVFGFVVDCVYILGYRRKSNLLIATAACTIGWICMGFWVEGLVAAIIAKLSINISIGIENKKS